VDGRDKPGHDDVEALAFAAARMPFLDTDHRAVVGLEGIPGLQIDQLVRAGRIGLAPGIAYALIGALGVSA